MNLLGANPVDVVVLVVVLVSALLALLRGFVAEVLSFIGFAVAIAVTIYLRPHLQPFIEGYLGRDNIPSVAATIAILFFGTLIFMSAISYAVSRQIRATRLSAADRSLGFLLGLMRGWLIVCLLYIPVQFVFKPADDDAARVEEPDSVYATLQAARTQPMLASGAAWIMSFAPKNGLSMKELTAKGSLLDFMQPKTAETPADVPPKDGYTPQERQDLNRVLDTMSPPAEPVRP